MPLRRLYGTDFVFDEHVWSGRLTGRAFDLDGHGRWISHRVLWLLEAPAPFAQNIARHAKGMGVAPERILFAPDRPQDRQQRECKRGD